MTLGEKVVWEPKIYPGTGIKNIAGKQTKYFISILPCG